MKVDMNDLLNSGVDLDTEASAPLALLKEKFNSEFADWIALQNKHFEEYGLWCDGLVPWTNRDFDGSRVD